MDEQNMMDWWVARAKSDAQRVIPKALEYSASDLLVIGSGMCPKLESSLQIEAGIGFYLLGKAARITGALTEQRAPSNDTWDDAGVYSFMGRYVREFGQWP